MSDLMDTRSSKLRGAFGSRTSGGFWLLLVEPGDVPFMGRCLALRAPDFPSVDANATSIRTVNGSLNPVAGGWPEVGYSRVVKQ